MMRISVARKKVFPSTITGGLKLCKRRPWRAFKSHATILHACLSWSLILLPQGTMASAAAAWDGGGWWARRVMWALFVPGLFWVLVALVTLSKTFTNVRLIGGSMSTDEIGSSNNSPGPLLSPALAIVVPTNDGDIDNVLFAMSRWPPTCYETTLHHVDLILHHATNCDKAAIHARVPPEGSACFRNTIVISSNLTKQVRRGKYRNRKLHFALITH